MAPPLLRAFVAMMPRLDAEDTLRTIQAVALGSGSVKDAKQAIREIAARAGTEAPRRRATSAEMLAFAKSMGVLKVERA